ncbi:MAG: MFS transporter [Gammaproteobacteria bacterium]|nr:MFS transporter [Gammaproteobacteria bacterium]MBU2675924.1 MFS transporter [Gammaproteobacteria bacterium]NNC56727.1 MFS transporter [Woeseiaceae bacterium]NNL49660.1 MFS transporter [Woeseiaceae bacterium]
MPGSSQFKLLGQRRFAPFFATQFLGALNDNIFRNGLVILITFQGVLVAGMNHTQLANVAAGLFILPFFLFSATAGQLADKYEKSMLFRRIKTLEIALMLLAAFALVSESYPLLLLVLFLMGCQSTMFGPVKYAYLPQKLDDDELVGGNALVESGTYVAIILGLIIGGIVVGNEIAAGTGLSKQAVLGACLIAVALSGYMTSRQVPRTPAVDPTLRINWNAWQETWRIIQYAREERSVFLSILGISWFWFFGSAMTIQIPAYTLEILNGNEAITTCLLTAFAVGVGIGSLLCERMSGHRIELGLVPFGAIGLSLFAIDLYFAQPDANSLAAASIEAFLSRSGSWRILADLALLGAFGGFYSVPLYALIQKRAKRQHLSRIIAANNIINALLMVSAAILSLAVLRSGFSIPELFVIIAVLNAVVAVYIFSLLPEFLMRFLAWIVINVVYRLRPTGLDNIPSKGPAVVVCNHVSFMDPVILGGSVRRPMRFVMWYKIFEIPLLNFLFKTAKAIPIASAKEDKQLMDEAFEKVDAELAAGNVVCIFPEGGITSDGEIQRFRPGIEKIIQRRAVPVVPAALGRLWGSWFSRRRSGGIRKIPGRLFARVPVSFGKPVPPSEVTAEKLELLVRTLRGDTR